MPTPSITLTGSLQTILGTAVNNGGVIFTLVNYGAAVPQVSGTSIIVTPSITATATSGSFTVTLWGNDVISPGPNITFYEVSFLNDAGAVVQKVPYQFIGSGTFDISTLAPYNQIPVLPAAALTNAVLLNPTANQTIQNFSLIVPALLAKNIENIRYADQFASIQAAIDDLPSSGGEVYIPAGTYTQTTAFSIPNSNITIRGAGVGATTINTTITSGDLFPIAGKKNIHICDLTMNNSGTGGGTAIHLNWGWFCVVERFYITGPFSEGIELNSIEGSGSCIFNRFSDGQINATNYGILIDSKTSVNQTINGNIFQNLNVFSNGTAGFRAQGNNGPIINETTLHDCQFTAPSGIGVSLANNSVRNLLLKTCTLEASATGLVNGTGNTLRLISNEIAANTANVTDSSSTSSIFLGNNVGGFTPIFAIDPNGALRTYGIGIGGSAPSQNCINGPTGWLLQASGTGVLTVNNTSAQFGQPVQVADGSKTAPSFAFTNDSTTGLYRRTAGFLSVAAGNIETALFGSDRFHIGTNLRFGNGDTSVNVSDTGISRTAAATIAIGNGSSGDTSGKLIATTHQIGGSGPNLTVDTGRFGNFGVRVQSSSGNNASALSLMPVGTATESNFRLFNTSDASNAGALELDLNGTAAVFSGVAFGTGTAPTRVTFNGLVMGIGATDTGISRSAAAAVAIGNGTAGDQSGFLRATGANFGSTTSSFDVGLTTSGKLGAGSLGVFGWSATNPTAALDTGLSRTAAGTLALGNGTQGDKTGTFIANVYQFAAATDTGLSRTGVGIVAVGNGTQGDGSGTVTASRYLASTSNANVTPVTVTGVTVNTNLMALTLPAGDINTVGRWIRVVCRGYYSTGATGGTLAFVLKMGSTTLKSQSFNMGNSTGNAGWFWYVDIMTQTAGASGAVEVQSNIQVDAVAGAVPFNTATIGTFDLTASQTLTLSVTPSQSTTSVTQRMMGIAKEN